MAVEEAQLLLAVGRIRSRIDVQNDFLSARPLRPTAHEPLQTQALQSADRFPGDRIFQPRQGRLRSQRQFTPAHHRAQSRIVAQKSGIVGVFVARGDLIDALAQQIEGGMFDIAPVALISHQSFEASAQLEPLVEFPQQHQARLAGNLAPGEIQRQLGLESKAKLDMTLCSHRHLPSPPADVASTTYQ